MRAKIKYAIFVKEDVLEFVNWYNQAQKGLGIRFLKEVKEKINYIDENPENILVRYQDVQIAVVKFPFTVHFRFLKEENTLWILGVFHTSINPDKWRKRL
jgi:hypothetical protein